MTTIDHRILIPAPPQVVWEYISNISRNPKWQVDCQSIAFLTEKHDGQGTRWRCTTAHGREHVIEITAWYNGLGYEYVYVDGPGYEENRGRLRLQEIPEGTIVQWTFNYTLGGLLGGMRDALRKRREIDSTMADSLRKLYTQLKTQSALSMTPQGESKALIREAPDVEARANYTPRHPSVMQEHHDSEKTVPAASLPKVPPIVDEPPIAEDDGQELQRIVIPEPLVAEDDTRPNPIILREPPPPAAAGTDISESEASPADEEPEFMNDLAELEAEAEAEAEDASKVEIEPESPAPQPEPEPEPEPPAPSPAAAVVTPPLDETRRADFLADKTRKADMRESAEIAPIASDDAPSVEVAADEAAETPVEAEVPAEPAPPEPEALPPLPPALDPDTTRLIDFPTPEAEAEPPPAEAQPEPAAEQEQVEEQPEAAPAVETPPDAPPVRELKPWEEATVSVSRLLSEPGKMDTATMSIWEIFGVERPSETQELKAIVVPGKAEPHDKLPTVRMGLRMALRRKLVKVRHP